MNTILHCFLTIRKQIWNFYFPNLTNGPIWMCWLIKCNFDIECKEYYDDYWIFGPGAPLGPKRNDTSEEDEDEDQGSGSGDGEDGEMK